MRTRQRRARGARAAFTLIELMVVITIIAVLVALLMAGVSAVMGRVAVTKTRAEIAQFEVALTDFRKTLNDVTYVPSQIILREDMAYGSSQLEADSLAFLQRAFGKRINAGGAGVDWNGDGTVTAGSAGTY